VQCPKDRDQEMEPGSLAHGPAAYHCPECEGNWISSVDYEDWREAGTVPHPAQVTVTAPLGESFAPALNDTRASLCPECQHYLSRVRVGMGRSFYVERCSNCGGIWCDRGEWNILHQWNLSRLIDRLFTPEWQERVRQEEWAIQERQALIDKIGDDLAQDIFKLAKKLETHPNGDFAVAYLMRRFDRS
jgi:Zn-finger nucleic acid-binding protein